MTRSRTALLPALLTSAAAAAAVAALAAAGAAGAEVSPGDRITAENAEQVRGLIPEELYPYVIEDFDDLAMQIVETQAYPPDPKYVEATVRYACQASLDENGNLVDYVAGQPFPYSDWATEATDHACDLTPDDPQFALKLAWNANYRWQRGGYNYPHWGFSYMRNGGKDFWRLGQGEYRRTYFSHRADLLPETHQLNPGTDVEWAEFFDVKDPFDLRGTMFLLYRYTGREEDDTWAYIPSLRRVRRIATTQKSDSLLGTEFTLEDFYLFSGYVWDHKWEFQGESELLAPMNTERDCFPKNLGGDVETKVTGMTRLGSMDEWRECEFGPYGAGPFENERWQKRTLVQLDDIPRQEGHPYSRKKIWYDKETMMPKYAITYDRSGKPFKILANIHRWSEDTANPVNHGANVLIESSLTIVNLQSLNSHVLQMFTSNVAIFSASKSREYFDTNRLRKAGR